MTRIPTTALGVIMGLAVGSHWVIWWNLDPSLLYVGLHVLAAVIFCTAGVHLLTRVSKS